MILKIYLSNALPIAVKIIGGLFVLRVFVAYLGKDGLGLVSQYQSIITLGYGLFNALIFNFAVKSQWKSDAGSKDFSCFLAWVIKVSLFVAAGVAAASLPLSSLLFNDSGYAVFVFLGALQLPVVAVYIALSARMCSENGQIKYNAIVAVSTAVAFIGVWLWTRYFEMNGALIALAAFYVPAFLIQGYAGRSDLIGSIKVLLSRASSYNSLPLLKFSFVAIVSAFLAVVVQMAIRSFILESSGWDVVGEWQTITKISESYLMLASIPLFTFFLPRYSSLVSVKQKLDLLVKISLLSFFIVSSVGLIIYLSWNGPVVLVIGSQFSGLKNVFGFQVIGDVFKILSWVFMAAALGDNKIALVLFVEFLFAAFYCGLVYWIFPTYGLEGSVLSYGFSYFLAATGMLVFYRRIYGK
ncbi:MAG: hypothetical protein M3R45_13280 [Pseudomonadota bacterium]|nr:hypothetical protein [Pseudomonadota bacterium]